MSDTPLVLQPLVPVPAGSYSWLDLLVVPLCLLCSITLHICFAPPEHVLHRHQAFLYRMSTSHARFLPKESQHAFKYSTLNLGVDLDALEQGLLDVGSRWFAFNQRRWTLFAFHSDMFSSLPTSREEQDRPAARVRKHLQERGVPPHHASKIFTVAMPAYAGFAGINPLVVHYCYATSEKSHLALQVVVLEVHNTFEERHIYVLRVGQDQDERRSPGYDHQWTFRRAFHVSPFNDRSGFYQVSLVDPLDASPDSETPCGRYDIKILLLTPEGDKKLMATLSGDPPEPLSESSILRASLRFPFSLFLTTARIVYQAFLLHYFRKLNVFPRPELFVGGAQTQTPLPQHNNPVHHDASPGSIHWQQPSADQLFLKQCFEQAVHLRLQDPSQKNTLVILQPSDFTKSVTLITHAAIQHVESHQELPSQPDKAICLRYHSFDAFQDLALSATLYDAAKLGAAKGSWEVDNVEALQMLLFPPRPSTASCIQRICAAARQAHCRWSAGQVARRNPRREHWTADIASLRLAAVLSKSLALDATAYYVFRLLRADFVEGTSPWHLGQQIQRSDYSQDHETS